MNFEIIEKSVEEIDADFEIVLVLKDSLNHKWIRDKKELNILKFKAQSEESALLLERRRVYVVLDSIFHEDIRVAVAKAYKLIKNLDIKSVKVGLYSDKDSSNIRALVEGLLFSSYEFSRYKSKKSECDIENFLISTEDYTQKNLSKDSLVDDLNLAQIVSDSVNFTRDLVNTPPDDATPIKLAEVAAKISNELNLECKIEDENFLEREGMGAFLAVSRASAHPPRLIHIKYKGENPKLKIAIVGKGLTYDSGGLSLKPSEHMATMKADKSGGCATLGIVRAIAKLGLNVEIDAIVGATENMIGGDAYKPDDILIAKNKKSIEVKNTDAEGRLVLADCLCYAQEQNPDFIIDLATLTGACVVALGEYSFGIMGNSDTLKKEMFEASKKCGELSCELHFNRYLKKLIKSEIADMSNIASSRYGGALSAAIFLSNFIEDRYQDSWLHLDIAGPAFVEKEWGYNPYGGSGAGVRSVVEWIAQKIKEER